ncbi:hypothetical protein R1sor_012161 [Riccia sorocarpa]|uniref:Uncharacterized protein n=1 Tax=Riccia sorocarpa TaxID=122646 RepID=A0ABD3I302_9MARC
MVTNPYGHQGFGGFRARFVKKKKFGVYPEPKHYAFLRAHGMKRVFDFMRTEREFPEVGSPSNAEVGADDTAGADDGADGAAAGSDVGADDYGAEFSDIEGSGDEFEEDDQGQAPQQERVEELEDAEDDEEDEAIPLGPPSGVLRAIPRDPQPSVARIVTPPTVTLQPSPVRAVVSDPSRAVTTVPEPSSRQTRAQSQPTSARGIEEQRGKKSKKSKK